MTSDWAPTITDLAEKLFDNELSPDEQNTLNQLLSQGAEQRSYYLAYANLLIALERRGRVAVPPVALPFDDVVAGRTSLTSGVLGDPADNDRLTADALPPAFPASGFLPTTLHGTVGYFSSGWPLAYLVATVFLGIGLLIGTLVHVSRPGQIATQPTLPSSSSSTHYPLFTTRSTVGRITGMVDCQWSDPQTEAFNGAYVPLGRKYALASGLMEIAYDTGAKVILQGPVTYEVESAAGGFLSIGKLTARLEKNSSLPSPASEREAGGEGPEKPNSPLSTLHSPLFAVRTPTAVVTDLGTEFGVEVDEQGTTTSHVFHGSIKFEADTTPDGGTKDVRILKTNESGQVKRVDGGQRTEIRLVEIDPASFVRAGDLSKPAKESKLSPFHRWKAYSEQLRKDTSLLAYYDFQPQPGDRSVLPNVAANRDASLDGVIENAVWNQGRMTGKQSLRFENANDRVRINLPQTVDDLTLAAWVYVENANGGLLMSDGWRKNGLIHWQFSAVGQIYLNVYGFAERPLPIISPPVFDAGRLFRWTHLAVAYDHRAASIWFYTDGRAVGQVDLTETVPICIGSARIGQWDFGNHIGNEGTRNFHGRIDELAIFGRTLKVEEIHRMFEAGRPADDGGG